MPVKMVKVGERCVCEFLGWCRAANRLLYPARANPPLPPIASARVLAYLFSLTLTSFLACLQAARGSAQSRYLHRTNNISESGSKQSFHYAPSCFVTMEHIQLSLRIFSNGKDVQPTNP